MWMQINGWWINSVPTFSALVLSSQPHAHIQNTGASPYWQHSLRWFILPSFIWTLAITTHHYSGPDANPNMPQIKANYLTSRTSITLTLWSTHTHKHTHLWAPFRSDNSISQTTSHVAVKAPVKSAGCCKSLVWFGACKPLASYWPANAKRAVGARWHGWGYMVRLGLYLMHHLPLRCFSKWQPPQNWATFLLFHLTLMQTDKFRRILWRRRLPLRPQRAKEIRSHGDSDAGSTCRKQQHLSVVLHCDRRRLRLHAEATTGKERGVYRLTGNVIVPPSEELQAPQVGAELLELERVLHVLVGFVAVQQEHVLLVHGAALHLTLGDHVDSVELLLSPGGTVRAGTHDVHLVSNLGIQYQTLVWIKSAIKWKIRGWKWSGTHFISCLKSTNKITLNLLAYKLINYIFCKLSYYWNDTP